jgi:predicted nucleotidyltransferase component of viral defense system
MIHTARQLKDLVRNRSKGDSRTAQTLLRIYCMERFLERVSVSRYKDNFILKGGMLVSSLVGIERRATMDIDTTIKGQNLSIDDARRIVNEIISIPLDDEIRFEILDAQELMEGADYTGVRLSLRAKLDTMKIPVKIDISTGDVITPVEVLYSYKLMFEEREIELLSYNLITILAEKIETVISRGTANTRLRDFYDIYILTELYADRVDRAMLAVAIKSTSTKIGSQEVVKDSVTIIDEL